MYSMDLIIVLVVLFLGVTGSEGFAAGRISVSSHPQQTSQPQPQKQSRSRSRRSHSSWFVATHLSASESSNNSNEPESNDDPSKHPFDVENARQKLESLVGNNKEEKETKETKMDHLTVLDKIMASSSSSSTATAAAASFNDVVSDLLAPPPPLTSLERDRRVAEIAALESLQDSDEAAQVLWNLWFTERGVPAQQSLQRADQYMADPTSWAACEQILRELIAQHGLYFVEPVNRLATLYYLQGRFSESYQLCLLILHLKPWHFGALSGVVAVCIALGNRNNARVWADRRLPSMAANDSAAPFAGGSSNPRRREWVQRAVAEARHELQQAEERTSAVLGKPEDYYQNQETRTQTSNEDKLEEDEEKDAWQ